MHPPQSRNKTGDRRQPAEKEEEPDIYKLSAPIEALQIYVGLQVALCDRAQENAGGVQLRAWLHNEALFLACTTCTNELNRKHLGPSSSPFSGSEDGNGDTLGSHVINQKESDRR